MHLIISLWTVALVSLVCVAVAAQGYTTLDNASKRSLKQYEEALELQKTGQTGKAISELSNLYDKDSTFIDVPLKLAELAYLNDQPELSAEAFEKAVAIDSFYAPRTLYSLGRIYYSLGEYTRSRQLLARFLEVAGKNDKASSNAGVFIEKARFGEHLVSNPVPFEPELLKGPVNTPEDDESLPSFTADGQFMFFTKRIRNEDLYLSQWDSVAGIWGQPESLTVVNTISNEGAHAVSADGSMIVYTACGKNDGIGSCDLYFWRRIDGEWHRPVNAGGINSGAWDAQPSLTPDGRGMYFSSDRPGGFGGRDLWYTERHGERWTRPVNLGPKINTSGDEESPFIFYDSRTLYFMSDGHEGLGQSDIFMTTRNGDTWTTPVNLGYPINTHNMEGAFAIDPAREYAYFTSDLRNGRNDIYRFRLDSTLLPPPVSNLTGIVTDANTRNGLIAEVVIYDLTDSTQVGIYTTDQDGTFSAILVHGTPYGIHAAADGYLFWSDRISVDTSEAYGKVTKQIRLIPVDTTDVVKSAIPVVLRNIEFQTGSSELLRSSIPELRRLSALLTTYPNIRIEIRGHTDNVGEPADNRALSESRAVAVRDWLTASGIDPSRLSARGYGESQPIESNETEEGRQANRRVEFLVK